MIYYEENETENWSYFVQSQNVGQGEELITTLCF